MPAITIPLTDDDRRNAVSLSEIRNSTKEQYQNKSTGKHSDIDTDIIGALGEIAYSNLTGAEIDWSVRKHGDEGVDFYIAQNITVEVKTRETNSPNTVDLAVFDDTPWKIKSDLVVLCVINPEHTKARFLGFTTKLRMIYLGTRLKFGRYTRWGCSQDLLHDMKWLIDYIERVDSIKKATKS